MDDEDEDFVCYSCGDDIPCCHMDDVPLDLRLCDACTYTALVAARARIARVEALVTDFRIAANALGGSDGGDQYHDCASRVEAALRGEL